MYKCSRLYKTGDGTHILNTPTDFKQTKNTTTFSLKSVLKGDVQEMYRGVVWCVARSGPGSDPVEIDARQTLVYCR